MTMLQFYTMCSLQEFDNLIERSTDWKKFERLQMASAQKLITQFHSNLQHLLLIPIGVHM